MNSNTLIAANMKTLLQDTSPEVEQKLMEMLRRQTPTERLSKTLYITSVTLNLSRRAIARANPGKSKRELDLLFVEYHYGKELAERVKKHIDMKDAGWK
jgi:hypothetical protein